MTIVARAIDLPSWLARLCLQATISKGAGHKYVRRVPTGNPKKPWKYYYTLTGGTGRFNEGQIREGAKFKLGEGHVHVEAAEDHDHVRVRHDETGEEHTLHVNHLANLLEDHHAEEVKTVAERKRTRDHARTMALPSSALQLAKHIVKNNSAQMRMSDSYTNAHARTIDPDADHLWDWAKQYVDPKAMKRLKTQVAAMARTEDRVSPVIAAVLNAAGYSRMKSWDDLLDGGEFDVYQAIGELAHEFDSPALTSFIPDRVHDIRNQRLQEQHYADEAERATERDADESSASGGDASFDPADFGGDDNVIPFAASASASGTKRAKEKKAAKTSRKPRKKMSKAFYTEVPRWLGILLAHSLEKGAGHKYLRRIPTGNPKRPWRYFYRVTGGQHLGHDSELVEGAAFRITDEGKEGHFHVEKVDGDQITIKHDESGKVATVSRDTLRGMLHAEHAEKIKDARAKAKANVEDAQKFGSDRQKSKTAEAAKKVEESFGPKKSKNIPSTVRASVERALKTLQHYRSELDRYRKLGGRYEAEVADKSQAEAAKASALVDEFLALAAKNNVDGEGIIADLGGRPSTDLSAEGAEWLKEREDRRARDDAEAAAKKSKTEEAAKKLEEATKAVEAPKAPKKPTTYAELAQTFQEADKGAWHDVLRAGHALIAIRDLPWLDTGGKPPEGRVLGLRMKQELETLFKDRGGYYGADNDHTPMEIWAQKVEGAEHVLKSVAILEGKKDAPAWVPGQLEKLRKGIEALKGQRELFEAIQAALPNASASATRYHSAAEQIHSWLSREGDKALPGKAIEGPKPVPRAHQKAPGATPKTAKELFEAHGLADTVREIREGTITAENLKAEFKAILEKREEIRAQLGKLTKDELVRIGGRMWSDTKKAQLVDGAWHGILERFNVRDSYQWSPGQETTEQALTRVVNATTQAHIDEHAAKVAKRRGEVEKRLEGVKNPKNLAEFKDRITALGGEHKLTPEERRRYDEFTALDERERAEAELQKKAAERAAFTKRAAETSVENASAKVIPGKHTKKGHDIFTVQLDARVSGDDFKALSAKAKGLGGYYSSFRGNGAIPGFIFESNDVAQKFATSIGGGATPEAPAQEPEAEAESPKLHGSGPERLRKQAATLQDRADEAMGVERQANTARRANMAASADARARSDQATARTMLAIADGVESGELRHLWGVKTRAHLDLLEETVQQAKYARIRAEGRASDQDAWKAPPTAADADAARFPHPFVHKDHARSLALVARELRGGKQASARILAHVSGMGDNEWRVEADTPQMRSDLETIADLATKAGKEKYSAEAIEDDLKKFRRATEDMGVKSLPQYRAMLREYMSVRRSPDGESKLATLKRGIVGNKIPGYFPTPPGPTRRVMELADIQRGMTVLEPSAGSGNLADAAKQAGGKVAVGEVNASLREILAEKGHELVARDTLEHEGQYDRVVMNPPFENGQDIDHVQHAFDRQLAVGGRLVAIVSRGALERSDKKATAFRAWLEEHGAHVEELPDGSFGGTDSERKTGVATSLIVVNKPGEKAVTKALDAFGDFFEKAEKLRGGHADGKSDEDFDAADLDAGTEHEREHTDDEDTAREIARDHLDEDPDYYRKLKDLEKGYEYQRIPPGLGAALWAASLEKGAGHKYIRRVPTGNSKRPWRYFYRVTGGKQLGHDDEMVVGASFRVKDGDKEGHFHITGVDGDKITIKHDESGKTETLAKERFREILHNEHVEAIKAVRERAQRTAEEAKQYGSEKQKSKTAQYADKLKDAFEPKPKKPKAAPKDMTAANVTERLEGDALHDALRTMGDYLHGLDRVREQNQMGFNKLDYASWLSAQTPDRMQRILRKYKRQLVGAFEDLYFKAGLGDPRPEANGTVGSPRWTSKGDLLITIHGFIPRDKFGDYTALQKKHGLQFNGAERAWYVPAAKVESFKVFDYQDAMKKIGITVSDPPDMPEEKKAEIKQQVEAEKARVLTAQEVRDGIAARRVHNKIAVIRKPDGRFAFYAPYSPKYNDLFSNKTGQLTGITEYNKNDNHARETFDLGLVEEAIDKLQKLHPEWEVVTSGVEEAKVERERRNAELQKPIPEVQQHLGPGISLFPYQNEMVRFLEKTDGNALVGDEMGLGKTMQSLAYCAAHGRRAIVVCPKVVRRTWLEEAEKFFPGKFRSLELRSKDLKRGMPDLTGHDLVSVNYESLEKFGPALAAAGFDTIIVDESHRMKNPKAKTTKAIQGIAAKVKHRILLSGTAVKNKKEELFTQIDLVRPGLFDSAAELKSATIGGTWNKMRDVYLARQKAAVLKDLPAKTTTISKLEVPGAPDLAPRDMARTARSDSDLADDAADAMAEMDLRDRDVGSYSRLKADLATAKAPATTEMVQDILEGSDSKVLVFSDSVEAAKSIAEKLGDLAILHHGQMSDDKREAAKKEFQRPETDKRVFVSTRQSLAVGATLTAADKVVFNDLPWTAADVRQAEDRAHRVGQKKSVNVYWVTVQGNEFDEGIADLVKKKYDLSKKINEGKQLTEAERKWMDKPISMDDIRARIRGEQVGPKEETPDMTKSYAYEKLPTWLGAALWDADLTKGAGHKYLRRVPTGNPKKPWRYYYRVTGGAHLGHDSEMLVGAAFAVKDGDQAGHFHVTAVDGDQITIKHDESGREHKLTKGALREMLHKEHAESISGARARAKAMAEAAAEHGASEKMKAKTSAAAQKLEESFGAKPKKPSKEYKAHVDNAHRSMERGAFHREYDEVEANKHYTEAAEHYQRAADTAPDNKEQQRHTSNVDYAKKHVIPITEGRPTKHSGPEDADVKVSFHPGEGIVVSGTSRSQAAAIKDVMQKHGLRFSSQLGGWFKPQSRSWRASDYRAGSVHAIASDLTAAGVEARGEQGFANVDAAEREATRQTRSVERAGRLEERAAKHASEADTHSRRADKLGERFYMGQPILVGHHSEKSARSAQEKMHGAMRRSIEAKDKADHYAHASDAAARNAEGKTRTQMARKIEELEAEARSVARSLEKFPDSEQAKLRSEEVSGDLAYWRGELKKTGFDAEAARAEHKVGDIVLDRGSPAVIRRVGPKNVTVRWLSSPELGDQPGKLIAGIKALTTEQQATLREKYAGAFKHIESSDANKKAKPEGWHWKGKRTTPAGYKIANRRDHGFDFEHPSEPGRSYSIHHQAFGDQKYYAEATDKKTTDTFSINRKTTSLGKFATLAEAVDAAEKHASEVQKAMSDDITKSDMLYSSERLPGWIARYSGTEFYDRALEIEQENMEAVAACNERRRSLYGSTNGGFRNPEVAAMAAAIEVDMAAAMDAYASARDQLAIDYVSWLREHGDLAKAIEVETETPADRTLVFKSPTLELRRDTTLAKSLLDTHRANADATEAARKSIELALAPRVVTYDMTPPNYRFPVR